jgi:hypothetical protein
MTADPKPWELTLRTAGDLTPALLTWMLRRYDAGLEVTVAEVRRTWQGTTSHVHLDVSYASPRTALPTHLFVKTQLDTVHDLPEAHDASLSEAGVARHC